MDPPGPKWAVAPMERWIENDRDTRTKTTLDCSISASPRVSGEDGGGGGGRQGGEDREEGSWDLSESRRGNTWFAGFSALFRDTLQ